LKVLECPTSPVKKTNKLLWQSNNTKFQSNLYWFSKYTHIILCIVFGITSRCNTIKILNENLFKITNMKFNITFTITFMFSFTQIYINILNVDINIVCYLYIFTIQKFDWKHLH
jgi:hypothetical protein